MTGLEKIIEKINKDCEDECESILSEAEAEAKTILDKAGEASALIISKAREEAENNNAKELTLTKSRAELDRKKALLAAKNGIVNDVINNALTRLIELPDGEYFAVITSLLQKYAQKGLGTLRLSKRDLARLPNGFEAELGKKLKEGFEVNISTKPIDISGGFILAYEDVEQNCSFDSLLAASRDEIKDGLYAILFKRDGI